MIEILGGTPLADSIAAAQQAMAAGDYHQATDYYHQALTQLPAGVEQPAIRRSLWVEHVGGLIRFEQMTLAQKQAEAYLETAASARDQPGEAELLLLLAEIMAAQGRWGGCRQLLDQLTGKLAAIPDLGDLSPDYTPRLTRLSGLLAAEESDFAQAGRLLNEALAAFTAQQNSRGQQLITHDLQRLALQAGSAPAVDNILSHTPNVQTTSDLLLVARALRRDSRFEAAARLIEERLRTPLDPALRFPLLHELVLLRQILADEESIRRLLPQLEAAAAQAANPAQAQAAVARLRHWSTEGFSLSSGTDFQTQLYNVRAFIQQQQLAQAEPLLRTLRPQAATPRQAAYWSLVAGELEYELGRANPAQAQSQGQQAVGHLRRAISLALDHSLPEIHGPAIRLMGQVYDRLYGDLDQASEFWARAGRSEELIAHRQETDRARIRYLELLPTQYDQLIAAAAGRVTTGRGDLLAGVIAAIEAARGAAILSRILPASAPLMRDLPSPGNPSSCLAWSRQITRRLPKDMAIWLLHATPNQIHHGLVGRDLLHWASAGLDRHRLGEAVEQLKECWEVSPEILEYLVQKEPEFMPHLLAQLADMLRLKLVLPYLPGHISRLAIVAGDALGDIPFGALPLPGSDQAAPLVSRYALSDLPCLSAWQPLAKRATARRGEACLAVRPPATGLTIQTGNSRYKQIEWLTGEAATPGAVERRLAHRPFPLVRFDCHGSHVFDEAMDSWLQLAADPSGAGGDGRLTAGALQALPLTGCGTLILGACESGMAQRLGRDERLGFVRAGLAAGASAVVASRWVAADLAANAILNRFQQYLGYLPRDRALQRAQLDLWSGRWPEHRPENGTLPRPDHPARWACWTLYGDAGWQTPARWLVRTVRRLAAQWQNSISNRE